MEIGAASGRVYDFSRHGAPQLVKRAVQPPDAAEKVVVGVRPRDNVYNGDVVASLLQVGLERSHGALGPRPPWGFVDIFAIVST